MKNLELKLEFVELRAGGNSLQRIADLLDISKVTAIRWQKELEAEICAREREMVELFRERYSLNAIQRLDFLAELFSSMKSEWQARGPGELSDREVLGGMLTVYRQLIKELEPGKTPNLPITPDVSSQNSHASDEIESVSSPGVFVIDGVGSQAGLQSQAAFVHPSASVGTPIL